MTKKFAVIISSTRPSRVGPTIADWFVRSVANTPDTQFELIDLRQINLPFLDEVHTARSGIYEKDHTKQWKALIDRFDGYVFVTAEYNDGYPAPLKNAIDYLSAEWHNKPAMIVSYGWSGGAGASAQLHQVLTRLKMQVTGISPALAFDGDTFDENDQLKDVDKSFADNVEEAKLATQQLVALASTETAVLS